MMPIKDKYDEVFQIEMEGWAYGIANYPGEIFPELIFRVIRELEPSFIEAIQHYYSFDIVEVATMFSKAAKYLVHEKDITFCILSILPPPSTLEEPAQFVLNQIVDQVENTYGGAIERMEKKWAWELKHGKEKQAKKAA
jgi:hypothetical protein